MTNNSHNAENNKRMEVSQQQVSVVVATFLMLAFFIFIAGVFWGKKSILEIAPSRLTTDSFADTIYNAFCSMPGLEEKKRGACAPLRTENDEEKLDKTVPSGEDAAPIVASEALVDQKENKESLPEEFYYVPLAAFNTLPEAQEYAKAFRARNVHVKPIERLSETSGGEARIWYQLVTEATTKKNELVDCVNRIKHLVKEKNIAVIALNSEQKKMLFG